MRSDFIIVPSVILVTGAFIFIKGFQNNLPLMEIITIFILFTGFLIGFSLLCASIAISINKIISYFIK